MQNYRNRPWFLALISLVVAFLLSPDLWIYLLQGHEGDSFYTLDQSQRAGLISVTVVLSSLLLLLGAHKSHSLYGLRTSLPLQKLTMPAVDFVGAFIIYYLFVWLSPQAYYAYYLLIFDDLPLQVVIKKFPDLIDIGRLIMMVENKTLSQYGLGLLGRCLLVQILLYRFVIFTDLKTTK